MAIIGFIGSVLAMLYPTALAFLMCENHLGAHTIGGVPNTWIVRSGCLLMVAVVVGGWYLVLHFAPFSISLKG